MTPTQRGICRERVTALFERCSVEGTRYHGVAEEGLPFRDIAAVIGRRLNVPVVSKTPEEAAAHFGWFPHFAPLDCPAASAQTQEGLRWHPT